MVVVSAIDTSCLLMQPVRMASAHSIAFFNILSRVEI
jgi:hypothetical protein